MIDYFWAYISTFSEVPDSLRKKAQLFRDQIYEIIKEAPFAGQIDDTTAVQWRDLFEQPSAPHPPTASVSAGAGGDIPPETQHHPEIQPSRAPTPAADIQGERMDGVEDAIMSPELLQQLSSMYPELFAAMTQTAPGMAPLFFTPDLQPEGINNTIDPSLLGNWTEAAVDHHAERNPCERTPSFIPPLQEVPPFGETQDNFTSAPPLPDPIDTDPAAPSGRASPREVLDPASLPPLPATTVIPSATDSKHANANPPATRPRSVSFQGIEDDGDEMDDFGEWFKQKYLIWLNSV